MKKLFMFLLSMSFVGYLSAQNQIGSTGNVGIGTLSPLYPLEVIGEARFHGITKFDSTAVFGDSTIIVNAKIAENLVVDGSLKISEYSTPGLIGNRPAFFDENGDILTLEPCEYSLGTPYWQYYPGIIFVDCPKDVKVGIGTDNPIQRLDVRGDQFISESLGIGVHEPTSRLDIKTLTGYNEVVARFLNSLSGITPQTNEMFFVSRLKDKAFNKTSRNNDLGIFWSDKLNAGMENENTGFVIGPYQTDLVNPGLRIAPNGFVGFGQRDPSKRVEISNGALLISGNNGDDGEIRLVITDDTNTNDFIKFSNTDGDQFLINSEGKLFAHEIEVKLGSFPDYVFEEDYNLRTLTEVEQFIDINKHLPDVPSEESVLKDGLNLGEMDAILLKKVEELTLYIIDQQKQIIELQQNISELQTPKN